MKPLVPHQQHSDKSRTPNRDLSTKADSRLADFQIAALFATLPFFSIRPEHGVSATLVVMVFISGTVALKQFFNWRVKLNSFDTMHVAFLVTAGMSTFFVASDMAGTALFKSIAYFISFIALRLLIEEIGVKRTIESAILGSWVGMASFVLVAVLAIASYGPPSGLDYYRFTVEIMRSINWLLGIDYDIGSAQVMRNGLGEIFALIAVLPLIFYRRLDRSKLAFISLALLLAMMTFSRRAVVCVALVVIIISFMNGSRKQAMTNLFVVAVIASIESINMQMLWICGVTMSSLVLVMGQRPVLPIES